MAESRRGNRPNASRTNGAAWPVLAYIHHLRIVFLVLDAIGLVVFTIAGCEVTLQMCRPLLIVIIAGMITGCVGGVLRDVLCNDVPLLFRSELYASVSVVAGALYAALRGGLNPEVATLGAFVVFRRLAIRYRWETPKFVYSRDWN